MQNKVKIYLSKYDTNILSRIESKLKKTKYTGQCFLNFNGATFFVEDGLLLRTLNSGIMSTKMGLYDSFELNLDKKKYKRIKDKSRTYVPLTFDKREPAIFIATMLSLSNANEYDVESIAFELNRLTNEQNRLATCNEVFYEKKK